MFSGVFHKLPLEYTLNTMILTMHWEAMIFPMLFYWVQETFLLNTEVFIHMHTTAVHIFARQYLVSLMGMASCCWKIHSAYANISLIRAFFTILFKVVHHVISDTS